MTHNLTDRQKAEWLDIVIERDEGYSCWYCKKPFSLSQNNFAEYSGRISPHLFDHLNNNRQDNRIDNVVLCCESCNNKKPHDSDMQILATDKLHDSEKRDYMREKFTKKAEDEARKIIEHFEKMDKSAKKIKPEKEAAPIHDGDASLVSGQN